MKCDQMLKLLSDFLDGQVDPALRAELEKHLSNCDPCRVVVDNLRGTVMLYRNDEAYELPLEFTSRLHAALKARWDELPARRLREADK